MVEAGWTDVVRLPGFWFACSVIFLANGLIALFANFWSLGVVEVVTALLAAASAVGMLRMRRRRGGGRSGDPGASRLVNQRKGSDD